MKRRVNVSSVLKFCECPFRWWAEYVMQRVPIATAPALDTGRLLHRIFERHFRDGEELADAARAECASFKALIPTAHESARPNLIKSLQSIVDLQEAFPLWRDDLPIDRTLAVEEVIEMQDPILRNVIWIMTPDAVVEGDYVYHRQNRGLDAAKNFATYIRLQNRSWHEHLYAEGIVYQHDLDRDQYGGTLFNLVRKLKYRTNVGKKNEETKSAAEMFYQQTMTVDLNSGLHRSVMASLRYHTRRMLKALSDWEQYELMPAENPKQNGGFSGNSEDPFFKVLLGEISLDDDNYFKDRIDPYLERRKA